jgi:hypothetical protein
MPGMHEYAAFTHDEMHITEKAVQNAGILCRRTAETLAAYNRGTSTDSEKGARLKLSAKLFEAFHICRDGAADPTRVLRLIHVFQGIAHNLGSATYKRLKKTPSDPEGDEIAFTEPGQTISLSPIFLGSRYLPHERAIILIHEGVHMLQNAHGYAGSRDVRAFQAKNRVPFEAAVFYPYLYQHFLSRLFHMSDPSLTVNMPGSTITPGH